MITEDYVSYEVGKLLKEKGFDWCTYAYYEDEDNPNISLHASKAINWNKTEFISKPTLQMACKWLREKNNILIVADRGVSFYTWQLENNTTGEYITDFIGEVSTYEGAIEAALKYTLENLI